jgi:DNA primase
LLWPIRVELRALCGGPLGARRFFAMISAETVRQVRERCDIVAVVKTVVPTLVKKGRRWVGLCPFHQEKTGSFNVNPERGAYYCFGCKENGSAIDFMMKAEGYTFPEAVRLLAEQAGIEILEEREPRDKSEQDRERRFRDDLLAANAVAAQFFVDQLHQHPHAGYAMRELEKRGLVPSWAQGGPRSQTDVALEAFKVGYAPGDWDALAKHFQRSRIAPTLGEALGLLAPRKDGSGHYDRFRHRLMFAVIDRHGKVIAFSGRALEPLPDDERAKAEPPPKYINSPESVVYVKGEALFGLYQAKNALRREAAAVVVEGNFDVVSLHARGIENVVAPLGTAFTFEQAKLLRQYTQNCVLMFDGDAAGKKAVRASREPLAREEIAARVATLGGGKDPDEVVRSEGGVEKIRASVQAAKGMLEYLLEQALDEGFVAADAMERARRLDYVANLLSTERNSLVRSLAKSYADELAGRLDLVRSPETFRALEQHVKKALEAETRFTAPAAARARTREPGAAERMAIVGALFDYPELVLDPEVLDQLEVLEGPAVPTVAALRRALHTGPSGEKSLDVSVLLAHLPTSIHAFAAERLAVPHHEALEQAKRHLMENSHKLRKLLLARETSEIARKQASLGGDWESSRTMAEEALRHARRRHGIDS